MPSKYVIHVQEVSHRFEPVSKSGIIAWEEGCLRCAVCVKTKCVYGVYENRGLHAKQMIDSIDNQCMNCLRCVQSCPAQLIHKSVNPEFKAMGDSHWTPNIIANLWMQAKTGKIPVSGAGYPGPFSGPGFDSMWTDMSEIVRPTRDGIHGREYISTAIDLGETPEYLILSEDGSLEENGTTLVDIPLPIILRMPPFGSIAPSTVSGWALAARKLGSLFSAPLNVMDGIKPELAPSLMPECSAEDDDIERIPAGARLVEIPWSEDWKSKVSVIRKKDPSLLISVRVPMAEGMEERSVSLAKEGISVIHLEGSMSGLFLDDKARYVKEGIRSVHLKLVEAKIRDTMTLLASGGISLAEHVAKAILCGVDGVFVDFPALIALECRMCRRCTEGLSCPVEIEKAPSGWVAARVVNLVGAWHNQLLELMGAMGIRDARRLRGEVGRAMFFEDLDEKTFGSMGDVEEGCELE